MKNKANPKRLLRQIREQVTLEAVQGTDGQAYLVCETTRVRLATPLESNKIIPLIKEVVSNALDCNITRLEARDILEVLRGELLVNPGGKRIILPRVGVGENGPELLFNGDNGKVIQFYDGTYKIVRRGTSTFIQSEDSDGFIHPLPTSDLQRGVDRFRRITRLSKKECMLVILWIIHAYLPHGPYLLLMINGVSGAGKSMLTESIRLLVDPSSVPTREAPRNERELFSAAQYNHIIAIDNASELKPQMLDALCRMSTGGGISIRKGNRLADEKVYGACRPVILNSIAPIGLRDDVLRRAIVINLNRRTSNFEEKLYLDSFKAEFPRIFDALLQAVAIGLSRIYEVDSERSAPMAGFEAFSIAAGSAFGWSEEEFRSVYAENQAEAFSMLGESMALLVAIRELIRRENEWHGTSTQLLRRVNEIAAEGAMRDVVDIKGLPKAANSLSGQLNRAREALHAFGIDFDRARSGGGKERLIHLVAIPDPESD